MQAIEKFLEENNGLVLKAIGKYSYRSDIDDIEQESRIALWKAKENFDSDLGYQFSTYAMVYIDGFIKRYILHKSNMIKVPYSVWAEENSEQYNVSHLEDLMFDGDSLADIGYDNNNQIIAKIFLEQILKELAPIDKELIELKYIHLLSDKDIAKKLNIKKDKVSWKLNNVMRRIKKNLVDC